MNKSEGELIFQHNWVKIFKENKDKVLEYWRKYYYLDEVRKTVGFSPKTKVLDVGCGISTVLHFIEGERYGIDPLAGEYLGMYRYPRGISVIKASGEKIPFEDGYFDAVFCTNVLDHVDNPQKVVEEIWRVLKDGGYFILAVHIFEKNFKRDPAHPHSFTRNDAHSLVRDRFQVILEKEVPAVGFYPFVVEKKVSSEDRELVLVLKKT